MDVSEILSLITASHSLFLAVLVWRFASNQPGSKRLVLFLINLALCFCADSWMRSSLVYQIPQLAQLLSPLYLLIGPLLLFYVQRALGQASGRLAAWLHCTPALLFAVLVALVVVLIPTIELRTALQEDLTTTGYDPLARMIQAHVGIYVAAALLCWYRFDRAVRREYASVSALQMRWLLYALVILSCMWVVWILGTTLGDTLMGIPYDICMVIGAYLLGYGALIHRQVTLPVLSLTDQPAATSHQPNDTPATKATASRYANSRLSSERINELRSGLEQVMARDCPFLDPDLTLSQLADSVGATSHELSQLLNDNLGQNFFDFINQHRIDDVKRCLRDPAYTGQSILDIALAAGFSSKAAFNAAFKRMVGVTPSQYRLAVAKAEPPVPTAT